MANRVVSKKTIITASEPVYGKRDALGIKEITGYNDTKETVYDLEIDGKSLKGVAGVTIPKTGNLYYRYLDEREGRIRSRELPRNETNLAVAVKINATISGSDAQLECIKREIGSSGA